MTDIKSMNLTEMAAYFKELGEPVFRAKQVFQWLHRGVFSFDEMTNLSKPLREKLAASCILYAPQVERRQVSSPGRHHQVPVAAEGWKLHRNGFDALSSWEYCVHLLSGGMPHGLCFLRLHTRGQGAGLNTR